MNQSTQVLPASQAKPIRRTCPKCGYIRETADKQCADCGKPLQSVSTIRILGVFLVLIGGGLLAFMSWLSLWMYQAISQSGNPNSVNHFNGNSKDLLYIIFVLGLVISISLGALTAGIWQIIFGKRNKLLAFLMIVLGIVFVAAGMAVFMPK